MRRDVHTLWKDNHNTQNGAGTDSIILDNTQNGAVTDSIILDNTETVQGQIPSFWTILRRCRDRFHHSGNTETVQGQIPSFLTILRRCSDRFHHSGQY